MRSFYGAADDKFVRTAKPNNPLDSFRPFTYKQNHLVEGKRQFNKDDVPIVFKTSPDTLLHYAAKVISAMAVSSVYDWSNWDVCHWLRKYGYPQYQITFRKNLITGRKLLIIDASALSAMNIKDFDHIRHIAYGIRQLFYYEMTLFIRSISLADEYHYELFKLFKCITGKRHSLTRRTELWREMQLMRALNPNYSHWEILERWMARVPEKEFPELFGCIRRVNLYRCVMKKKSDSNDDTKAAPKPACICMPPCQCHWTTKRDLRHPFRIHEISQKPVDQFSAQPPEGCKCMPPCTCRWRLPARVYTAHYMLGNVLTVLQETMPSKYDPLHCQRTPNLKRSLTQKSLDGIVLNTRTSKLRVSKFSSSLQPL